MIDSHTHLELCEPPDAELVAAAAEAGVNRIVTVGTDGASCRAALAAAEDFPQVYAAIGRHPNSATGFDDADLAELEALAAHPRCVAIGETGLDYYRDYAPREDQERAFGAQISLARSAGKPLVIHTRAAEDDTLSMLSELAGGVRVILHCFSMPDRIEECLAHAGWWISFAGNVTYPKASELRLAAVRVPADRLLVETDAPYLSPQVVRGRPNQPAHVAMTAAALAVERRVAYAELTRRSRRMPPRCSDGDEAWPELPGRPQHPGRDRAARGAVGGGRRARDRRRAGGAVRAIGGARSRMCTWSRSILGWRSRCGRRWRSSTTSRVHIADALDLDFALLIPAPTAVVANLPYGIAATVILRTIDELPSVGSWVVMVQREVGERLAAGPGSGAYGAPSVLAQLACEVRVLRPVSRTVFRPVPRVDSVLVGLHRVRVGGRPSGAIARP